MNGYRRTLFFSILMTTLGVVMLILQPGGTRHYGTVLIGVGGLFLIIGLAERNRQASRTDDGDPGQTS